MALPNLSISLVHRRRSNLRTHDPCFANGVVRDRGAPEERPSGGGRTCLLSPGLYKFPLPPFCLSLALTLVLTFGFIFQASMDMWLCMKRTKKAYEDGCSKVAEIRVALDAAVMTAKEAVQAAWEESERAKAAEIEVAVREAIRGYRSPDEFTALLDNEVGSEMANLLYRFKRFNPGQKLNLNFAADPPSLLEGIREEMIDDYEGEDAPEVATASEVRGEASADEDIEAVVERATV
ncbi:unnamed protein product [Prunus armeniaca]